jgi:hypothetical protein
MRNARIGRLLTLSMLFVSLLLIAERYAQAQRVDGKGLEARPLPQGVHNFLEQGAKVRGIKDSPEQKRIDQALKPRIDNLAGASSTRNALRFLQKQKKGTNTPKGSISQLEPCDKEFNKGANITVRAIATCSVTADDKKEWVFSLVVRSADENDKTVANGIAMINLKAGETQAIAAATLHIEAPAGTYKVSSKLIAVPVGEKEETVLDEEPGGDLKECKYTVK